MLGAGLAYLLTPENGRSAFGTNVHEDVSVARAFFLEFMFAFILTLAYLARDYRSQRRNYAESAVIIGLTYVSLHSIGVSRKS